MTVSCRGNVKPVAGFAPVGHDVFLRFVGQAVVFTEPAHGINPFATTRAEGHRNVGITVTEVFVANRASKYCHAEYFIPVFQFYNRSI